MQEIKIVKKEEMEVYSYGARQPEFEWLSGHGKIRFKRVLGEFRYWCVEPITDFAVLRVVRFDELKNKKDVLIFVFIDTSVYETEVDLEW